MALAAAYVRNPDVSIRQSTLLQLHSRLGGRLDIVVSEADPFYRDWGEAAVFAALVAHIPKLTLYPFAAGIGHGAVSYTHLTLPTKRIV